MYQWDEYIYMYMHADEHLIVINVNVFIENQQLH